MKNKNGDKNRHEELKKQLEELFASEQAKIGTKKKIPYPAPFLTINHKETCWELVDRNTGEKTQLSQEIEVATLQTYLRSLIFTSAGLIKALSQIVLPGERKAMLDVLSGERWDEIKLSEGDIVMNTWIVPVVIIFDMKPAIWEIKRSSLKAVLNFLSENNLKNLSSLVLKMKLIQRKEGSMKRWVEPKVLEFFKLSDSNDVKLLETCVSFYQEFKEFRSRYNLQAINGDGEGDEELEVEL